MKNIRRMEEIRADNHTNRHWEWSLFPLMWTCKAFVNTLHHTSFHLDLIPCKFTIALALKHSKEGWIICVKKREWCLVLAGFMKRNNLRFMPTMGEPAWTGQIIPDCCVLALFSHGLLAHVPQRVWWAAIPTLSGGLNGHMLNYSFCLESQNILT